MAKLTTKISSGAYKGKTLELPSLAITRSTKGIVKGSFFDSYRYDLAGAVFIEGFGGSGGMALEALSNGAGTVYAIEKDRSAYEITKRNFALFGIERNVVNADCFKALPQLLERVSSTNGASKPGNAKNENGANGASNLSNTNGASKFGETKGEVGTENADKPNTANHHIFVYLDPPFDIRDGFGDVYARVVGLMGEISRFPAVMLVAIEHASAVKMDEKIAGFTLIKSKKFGATSLSHYAR